MIVLLGAMLVVISVTRLAKRAYSLRAVGLPG